MVSMGSISTQTPISLYTLLYKELPMFKTSKCPFTRCLADSPYVGDGDKD